MSSTVNSAPFNITFFGSTGGPLHQELTSIGVVTPFTSAAAIGDALIIEGANSAGVDESMIRQALDTGALVNIVDPSPQQVTLMHSIVGAGGTGPTLLVGAKKSSTGKGCRLFHLAPGTVTMKDNKGGSSTTQLTSSGQIANAISAALAPSLDSVDLSGLYTPPLAIAGTQSLQSTYTWNAQMLSCDKETANQFQACTLTWNLDLYVYWVNGVSSQYYAVIARFSPIFSPGNILDLPTSSAQGFFQTYCKVHQIELLDSNNNPLSGALFKGHSPASSLAPVTTSLGLPMMIYAQGQNGSANLPFTAQITDPGQYSDWGVQDETTGVTPGWQIYQVTTWNTYQNNPNEVSNDWWNPNIYKDNNNVIAMPSESFGAIQADLVAAWEIHSDAFNSQPPNSQTPPSFPFTLVVVTEQNVAQDHAVPGCTLKTTHVSWGGVFWGWPFQFDLGTIAAIGNLAGN
jgi:hypothetical protein